MIPSSTENRQARIIRKLDDIPKMVMIDTENLVNLTDNQEDQFLQSIACLDIEAYRASIVLAWTAVADYLRRYFEIDDFQQLRALPRLTTGWRGDGPFDSVTDVTDLLENYFDKPIIEALKDTYKTVTRSRIGPVYNKLESLRDRRNSSAHPADQEPERVEAISFIIECLKAIISLTPKKIEQFR